MKLSAEQARQHGRDIQEGVRFNRYAAPRRRMEELWALICGQPIKFPARRRRQDREFPPKAA